MIIAFLLLPVDDLRLKVHVNNDWELRVSWNTSKYEAQAPEGGWNFKVSMVNIIATYNII